MSFWRRLWYGPELELEQRELAPDSLPTLQQQIEARWLARYATPYGFPTVREAMAVPAVWRSANLISNLVGTFPLDTFRNGELLDPLEAPAFIRRPDPFNSPRSFRRNTAWNLASYGEAIWWIARRDAEGLPTALINLHPPEVLIDWDDSGLRPTFVWRDRDISQDVQHLTMNRLGDSPRGIGPLQLCGAVMSAAAEATEWAARFMATGGTPSMVLKYPGELTAPEADALKAQWMSTPPNMPKVASGGLEPEAFQITPRDAQLIDVREQSVAEVARMFGLNPHVLLVSVAGSSLTYQNIGGLATELMRLTLNPNYLEPIQEAFSDLLPRTMVCRFAVDEFQRADALTRYQTYQAGIESEVLTVDEARAQEFGGLAGVPAPNLSTGPMPTVPRR